MKEGLSPEQKTKLITACLENVRNREDNQLNKQRILDVIKRLPDTKEINNLGKNQLNVFQLLYDGISGFRGAYLQLASRPEQAKNLDEKLDINEFLLKFIPNIVLLNDKLNLEGVTSKIFVLLLRQFPKASPKTGKDFLKLWKDLAIEKMQQKFKQKEDLSKRIKEELIPAKRKIDSPKKPDPEVSGEEEDEESSESPPVLPPKPKEKEKSEQEKAKEARQREKERQKEQEKERETQRVIRIQRETEERKKQQERKQRQENLKKSDNRQKDYRQVKGKTIECYINSRKDLSFEKGKSKEISDFLAAKLDQFLKVALEQMYDIACLKNKKNQKLGNELGYFSEENNRIQNIQEFYFQPNTKIYSLSYKHKHDIYSNLRIKEIKKEDELRNNLEAKTNEGEKKIDKKIQNYILKPRSKDSDTMLVPYREEKDGFRSQSITISIEHAIYFLENHPWLRNSLLLFQVYHRY